eukprot:9501492-Pyramimonas_sp.AAC.1
MQCSPGLPWFPKARASSSASSRRDTELCLRCIYSDGGTAMNIPRSHKTADQIFYLKRAGAGDAT